MSKRKIKTMWTDAQVELLVDIWRCRISDLRGQKRNSHIFAEMAADLKKSGHNFAAEEVRVKIHNLTNRYRIEKKKVGPSGGSPSVWRLYDSIHQIIGGFKVNENSHLVEESIESISYSASPSASTSREDSLSSSAGTIEVLEEEIPISEKKQRTNLNTFQKAILKEFKETNQKIDNEINRIKKVDEQILRLETRLVEAEEARNELIKQLLRTEQ